MSVLAALLVAVGVADLSRSMLARADVPPRRTAMRAVAAGLTALVVAAVLADLLTPAGAGLVVLAAVGTAAWVLVSEASFSSPRGHVLALLVLGASVALQLLLSGWAPTAGGPLGTWLGWAELPWSPDAERALLLTGLALVQLATGNVIVRLVLLATGAMAAAPNRDRPSEELKGGRLLGPLERLFILGLGLAGQVTAAGLVVAAKGLIRWPELSAYSREEESHIDKVTEYFLVGSFVSWLVALAGLVLALG